MRRLFILATMLAIGAAINSARACTGITLHSADGATITARTIEWAGNDLESRYSIVPRGHTQQSYVPGGKKEGMTFKAKYGYVGLAVEQEEFVVDGLNEAGLAAALFYFPDYGQYEDYNPNSKSTTVSDLQLVSWILSRFSTIDEVREAITGIPDVIAITAANAYEPSKADVHDRQLGVFLSNAFARAFREAINANPQISIHDLYTRLANSTTGSHVTLYNEQNYGSVYSNDMGDYATRGF